MVAWFTRKNETALQKTLREVLADEKHGVANSVLLEISDAASAPGADAPDGDRSVVFTEVWAALADKPYRHLRIARGLLLLEFLVKNSAPDVLKYITGCQMKIRALLMFEHTGAGHSIREKARTIIDLLKNQELLDFEREKASEYRSKFVGMGGAMETKSSQLVGPSAPAPTPAAGGGIFSSFRGTTTRSETELQGKLREALSTDKWGVANTILLEICDAASASAEDRSVVLSETFAALQEKATRWPRITKGLALLEALVKNGSEEVVADVTGCQMKVRALFMFEHSTGGISVRDKARALVDLLNDKEQLSAERTKARSHRDKFMGIAGVNSGGGYAGAARAGVAEPSVATAAPGTAGSAATSATGSTKTNNASISAAHDGAAKSSPSAPSPPPAAPGPEAAAAAAAAVAPAAAAARAPVGSGHGGATGWGAFEVPSAESWSVEQRATSREYSAVGQGAQACAFDLLDMDSTHSVMTAASANNSVPGVSPVQTTPAAVSGLDIDLFAASPAPATSAVITPTLTAPAGGCTAQSGGGGFDGLLGLDPLAASVQPTVCAAAPGSAPHSGATQAPGLLELDPFAFAAATAPPNAASPAPIAAASASTSLASAPPKGAAAFDLVDVGGMAASLGMAGRSTG